MVENTLKFGKNEVSTEELLASGHNFCAGCGEVLAMRLAMKAIGKDSILVMATGCDEVTTTPYPYTSWKVPWIHTLFENVGAVLSGVESGIKKLMEKGKLPQKDITFVGMGGDGATVDIGFQALSGAMERGHDFVYLCWDNEAYMNTGIQRSASTPYGASTTTAPAGKVSIGETQPKKDMIAIAVAHGVPYAATACIGHPFDLMDKVKKAARKKGPAYIHIYAPCPTGWRHPGDATIEMARLAVETGYFPLYEVEDGKYRITVDRPKLKPVIEFIKPQGRFRHLKEEDINKIQEYVNNNWERLKKLAAQE